MILFPAIDIKDGKVVRLAQGKFDDVTEYGDDPIIVANQWAASGARWLHVVDLDGAKTGGLQNADSIIRLAQTVDIPVQIGGGIRTLDDIEKYITGGISRVILGTSALVDKVFLNHALDIYNDKIAVSLDCLDGNVAKLGWVETTDNKATDFAMELETLGVKTIIYTDIKRDGMLTGPNFEALEELLDTVEIDVIASGGISNIDDIRRLKILESKGLLGCITGKAIYEGSLDIKEALAEC